MERCDQCLDMMINGVYTHEIGCPNTNKVYYLSDWVGNRLTDFKGNSLSFKTFDDGWDYILQHYNDEDIQELSIDEE